MKTKTNLKAGYPKESISFSYGGVVWTYSQ
jgi:hypothetical protein